MRLFLILFFILKSISYSQEKKTSSYDVDFFENINSVDFTLQNKYNKICFFFKEQQYDSCYVYVSNMLNQKNTLLRSEKDNLLFIQGISALEKKIFKKAELSFLQIKENEKFKDYFLRLGYVYLNLEKYKMSIECYKEYEKNIEKAKIENKKTLYKNLGIAYVFQEKYKLADESFLKAFKYVKKEDLKSLISLKINLALVKTGKTIKKVSNFI